MHVQSKPVIIHKIPNEIVCKILRYLNFYDFVNVCFSTLFRTQIITQPWFFDCMGYWLFHLILLEINDSDLFKHGILIPILDNFDIYFAIDHFKFKYISSLLKQSQITLYLQNGFKIINAIWQSHMPNPLLVEHVKICSSYCSCLYYVQPSQTQDQKHCQTCTNHFNSCTTFLDSVYFKNAPYFPFRIP